MSAPDYEAAWREVADQMFEGGELDYEQFLEIGERTGTVLKVAFDPEKHTPADYCDAPEPGSDWYVMPARS